MDSGISLTGDQTHPVLVSGRQVLQKSYFYLLGQLLSPNHLSSLILFQIKKRWKLVQYQNIFFVSFSLLQRQKLFSSLEEGSFQFFNQWDVLFEDSGAWDKTGAGNKGARFHWTVSQPGLNVIKTRAHRQAGISTWKCLKTALLFTSNPQHNCRIKKLIEQTLDLWHVINSRQRKTFILCQAPPTGSKRNFTSIYQLNWRIKLEFSLAR